MKPFYHGVASGDPWPESVILWTRVTPETELPSIEVSWEIASDENFADIKGSGTFATNGDRDYTVKVEATGLQPGTTYFYRFNALEAISPVGTTKTAATDVGRLQFAAVSCSNYEWGYFNAYAALANESTLDAVVHLGDYIYEYGPGRYGDTSIGRVNIPDREIISLQDYRDRYALYRLDEDLQAAHAAHPFINIWDDHEIANNSYVDGAQNHQEDEGSYEERKAVARQVYYEWIPIRESGEHYRKFSYGNLADLIMLDERLAGRTKPADSLQDPTLQSPTHTILGVGQFDWLKANLTTSEAKWKLIGNQVIYSYLNWGRATFSINLDSWDGYPLEQQALADVITENNIENVVFLTGDTHSSWAFEVTNKPFDNYNPETAEGAFAVEFGATSINSANSDEHTPADSVILHEDKITNSPINPHLKYSNLRDHGYLLITVSEEAVKAEYKFVETLSEKNPSISIGKTLLVNSGEVKLREPEE